MYGNANKCRTEIDGCSKLGNGIQWLFDQEWQPSYDAFSMSFKKNSNRKPTIGVKWYSFRCGEALGLRDGGISETLTLLGH